jgi:hypothetical protein
MLPVACPSVTASAIYRAVCTPSRLAYSLSFRTPTHGSTNVKERSTSREKVCRSIRPTVRQAPNGELIGVGPNVPAKLLAKMNERYAYVPQPRAR